MSRRKDPRKHPPKEPLHKILDEFSVTGIRKTKEKVDATLKFFWDYYCDLALQRTKFLPEIKNALAEAAVNEFRFAHWQRVVTYRWSLEPLSSRGSLADPGGRFNIGDLDATRFPPFSSLYIGSDKETAMIESYGAMQESGAALDRFELSLTDPKSVSVISMSGYVESVINLENKSSLKRFVDIIKKFDIIDDLAEGAKALKLPPPSLVQSVDQLMAVLLRPDWRADPVQLDVPAGCQIFGQLTMESGIGGIVYPSKHNGKLCLALFPRNLENSESYVLLDDTPPTESVIKRLDASNWRTLS